jgi:hypothetical protein
MCLSKVNVAQCGGNRNSILREATIDVIVDLCNLVGRMNDDGWAFAFVDFRESRHSADLNNDDTIARTPETSLRGPVSFSVHHMLAVLLYLPSRSSLQPQTLSMPRL